MQQSSNNAIEIFRQEQQVTHSDTKYLKIVCRTSRTTRTSVDGRCRYFIILICRSVFLKQVPTLEILINCVGEGLGQFSQKLTAKPNPTLTFSNSMPESGLGAKLLTRIIGFSQYPIY